MKDSLNISYPFEARVRVESYLHGIRIDRFLVRHFRNYTLFRMQRMISAGMASVDEIQVKLDCRIHQGEEVCIRLVEPPDKLIHPEPMPIEVLYEDSWIIVIDKPAGQIAHPVGIYQTGTLSNAIQFHLDQQTTFKGLLRPGIVHRLDRMTSGVMVVAKDHLSHRRLSIDFQTSKVSKTYLALLEGELHQKEGIIESPIGILPGGGKILMSTSPEAISLRTAMTRYHILKIVDGNTFVKALPETGRNHQIRVHFASIGHPVIGDEYYGAFGKVLKDPYSKQLHPLEVNPLKSNQDKLSNIEPRHALHASQLNFKHPISGDLMQIKSRYSPEDVLVQFSEISVIKDN